MPFSDSDTGPSQIDRVRVGSAAGTTWNDFLENRNEGESHAEYINRLRSQGAPGADWAGDYAAASGRQAGLAREGYERAMSGQDSVAQQQLAAGQAEAQRMASAQAVGRGSNPLAQRAAVYSGGEQAGVAANQSAQLRAGETVAARGQYLGALGEQAAGIQGYDQMKLARSIEQAKLRQQWMEQQAAEAEADRQFGMQVAGMVTGGLAGGIGGAISDVRAKTNIRPAAAMSANGAELKDVKEKLIRAEAERDALERAMMGNYGPEQVAEVSPGEVAMPEQAIAGRALSGGFNPTGHTQSVVAGPMQMREEPRSDRAAANLGRLGSQVGEQASAMADYRAGQDADRALAGARGYTYEYTDEAKAKYNLPDGTRYGPMAQNLAAAGPIGRSMVTETPQGDLAIGRDEATVGNLALTSRLNEKMEQLKREIEALKGGG